MSFLVADPSKVNIITTNIKDLVKEAANAAFVSDEGKTSNSTRNRITEAIFKSVDDLGSKSENFIKEWNRVLNDFSKAVKIESIRELSPTRM